MNQRLAEIAPPRLGNAAQSEPCARARSPLRLQLVVSAALLALAGGPGRAVAQAAPERGHRPQSVDVHPMIEVRIGGRLFRGHVRRRAQRNAGGRQRLASSRLRDRLRYAEIRHQRVAAPQHDVLGLDVAVHYAVRVGLGQRVHHVAEDAHRVRDWQRALPGEPVAE